MKILQYFLGHNIMCDDGNVNLVCISMESTQTEVGSYEPFPFIYYNVAGSHLINDTWITAF
jgi:hypothetical protein